MSWAAVVDVTPRTSPARSGKRVLCCTLGAAGQCGRMLCLLCMVRAMRVDGLHELVVVCERMKAARAVCSARW